MQTVPEALAELDRVAPGAPLLALGQTIFWDEPMKAGIALAAAPKRKFIAGIHDTDYFAKLPSHGITNREFKAVPHNDTRTKGLWSAAAEFSALFGSETVVTKEALMAAGLRLEKITKGRPNFLDQATEAWGWRGIVALGDEAPIAADVSMKALYPELKTTLDWAIDVSLQSVSEPQKKASTEKTEQLRRLVSEAYDRNPDAKLGDFYRDLLPSLYGFSANQTVEIETSKTTELLRFNKTTCGKPRFDLVNLFISADSANDARTAYNSAIKGSEIYGLDRFGTGAIPFDLVIPGLGRGTLRIGPKAVIVMTHQPQFITLKQPLRHVQDLADAICAKFGDECVLIGKAVSLIGMLAREFVFIFHEGASSYVKYSRKFHDLLEAAGHPLKMNPIMRVKLDIWSALDECNTWIRLPEPFQRPFGTEELTAPSFSARWREVVSDQEQKLAELGKLRSPVDLINFLERTAGGSWHCQAQNYRDLHVALEKVEKHVAGLKEFRKRTYEELKALKLRRAETERAMGQHFRATIFEKEPSEEDLAKRRDFHKEIEQIIHLVAAKRKEIHDHLRQQSEYVNAPEVRSIHDRRRAIELEAELKRLALIRQAVITSKGLTRANFRPSAWWFPVLCPDGGWFRAAITNAQCYLEPLSS